MNREGDEPVEFEDCWCSGETELAIKIGGIKAGEWTWFPKSVIHDDSEVWEEGQQGTLIVKRWFAEKEGLV